MDIGDTFLLRNQEIDEHLYIVISDPGIDPSQVVIVSLTSYDNFQHEIYKDGSCILHPDDHPWILHQTCVSYRDGRSVSKDQLDALLEAGHLQMREPVGKEVLERIHEGAEKTDELPNKCRTILASQMVIEK